MRYKEWLFLISVLCTVAICQSQTKTGTYTSLFDQSDKDKIEAKADAILFGSASSDNTKLLADFLLPYYQWLYGNRNYKKIISRTFYIEKFREHNLDSIVIQKIWYYSGISAYKLNDFDQAVEYYEKVIAIQDENGIAAKAFSQLGRCYRKKNDYYRAIKFYELAQSKLIDQNNKKSLLTNFINTTQAYTQLASVYGYKKSLFYFQKADSLASTMPDLQDSYKYFIFRGLGDAYNQNETLDINRAASAYQKAIQVANEIGDSTKIAQAYIHLGNLYNNNDPLQGISYQKSSLRYTDKYDSISHFHNYLEIGLCYGTEGDYSKSLTNFREALGYLTGKKSLEALHDYEWLATCQEKFNLLYLLENYNSVRLKKYLQNTDPNALDEIINLYLLTDNLIDLIRLESKEFQSKLFWRKKSANIYGKAVKTCFLANDVEKAFYFMEKNKALLLTENLKEEQFRQSLSIPDSLLQLEVSLKKKIYLLQYNTSKNKDSIIQVQLGVERRLHNLRKDLKEQFKSYKILDIESPVLTLAEVKESIADETAILMYNIGQYDDYAKIKNSTGYQPIKDQSRYGVKTFHSNYGIVITKQTEHFFKIRDAEKLYLRVKKLTELAKKPLGKKSTFQTYNKVASVLYEQLIPAEIQEFIKEKKIIIVPDSYLHFLPFEALLINKKDSANYFIEQNEISYTYSNTFHHTLPISLPKDRATFAGFAPITFEDEKLTPLLQSKYELQKTSACFLTNNYLDEAATKKQFLQSSLDQDIIHIASHADAQDSISPWIAFKKDKLLQDEITLLKTRALLVTLSGCNTLLGKQETGEGVISLAREFIQSGAQSVVSSLWHVDDRATTFLMQSFYADLGEGQSKAAALRKAKLSYLANHSLSEISPYYWASLVLVGDPTAIIKSSTLFEDWWWLSIILIIVSFYMIWRYFTNKNK